MVENSFSMGLDASKQIEKLERLELPFQWIWSHANKAMYLRIKYHSCLNGESIPFSYEENFGVK